LGIHCSQHGIVYIEAFSFHIHDLTGLKAAVGAGDGVKYTGEFTLHIVVAAVRLRVAMLVLRIRNLWITFLVVWFLG
jgi:hypothetical protein